MKLQANVKGREDVIGGSLLSNHEGRRKYLR